MTKYPEIIQKQYMGRTTTDIALTTEQKSFVEKFRNHVDILRNASEDSKSSILLYPSVFGGGKTTMTVSTIDSMKCDSMKCDDIIFVIVVPSIELINSFIGNISKSVVWCVSCKDSEKPKVLVPYKAGKVPCQRLPGRNKSTYDKYETFASKLHKESLDFLDSYRRILDYKSEGNYWKENNIKYPSPNVIFCDVNSANHLNRNRNVIERGTNSKLYFVVD
tara:strand:- start:35 stop:694 length:660 start_codon:yes stop_codon:yes gene_type:complete